MVNMKMRHHKVFDRFSRNFLFHSLDHGDRPFLEERRFDHDHMVLHFHGHAVMIAALDVIYTLRYLNQFHFLLAPEVQIVHAHHQPAQRPLRHDALPHFRLRTDFGGDGETVVFIFRIVDESPDAFLANFVVIQEGCLCLRQPDAVVVAPIEERKLVERITVDGIVLGINDAQRQFVEAVELKFHRLSAIFEPENVDGYFAIDLIGISRQIRRIFGGIKDAYWHASHIAKACRIPARMHAFARRLAIGLRRFDHAADRKSTRLNSSHGYISYAVFCLKKKNNNISSTPGYIAYPVSSTTNNSLSNPARTTRTRPEEP